MCVCDVSLLGYVRVYCVPPSECYAVSHWVVNMWCHKQVVFGRRKALAAQLSAYLGKRSTIVYIHTNRTVDQTATHWNNKHQQYLRLFGIATHQLAFTTCLSHNNTQALWRRMVLMQLTHRRGGFTCKTTSHAFSECSLSRQKAARGCGYIHTTVRKYLKACNAKTVSL